MTCLDNRLFPQIRRIRQLLIVPKGFSLIELMVAIAVGLLLLAGVTALIVQQSSTRTELDKTNRQIENGRYAMQLLRNAIEHAGFYGEFSKLPTVSATASEPNPCSTVISDLDSGMPIYLQGYDSPATVPAPLSGCLADANHLSGTDIVVVRRADTAVTAVASAVSNQVYLQATGAPQVAPVTQAGYLLGTKATTSFPMLGMAPPGGTAPAADLRKYHVEIYFVSPCNVPSGGGTSCTGTDDNGTPIPTLKRLELSASATGPAFTTVPLVEGIENLQFDYGLDTDNDGSPDNYTTGTYSAGTTLMKTADWTNVMTVRVNILARGSSPTAGYSDTKTYLLNGPNTLGGAGAVTPSSTRYKHHVFSEVVRATNPSGRRER